MPSCGASPVEAAVAEALRMVAEACNSPCLRPHCRPRGAPSPIAVLEGLLEEAERRGCSREAEAIRAALQRLRGAVHA